MPLQENGTQRYCGQCDRNLVDFRNHSIEEILQYKKSLKGEKFCGIFRQDHIRTEIIIQPRFESRKTVFTNSLMVLAALSMLTACQTNESDSTTGTPVEDTEQSKSTSAKVSVDKEECVKSDTSSKGVAKRIPIIDEVPIPDPPIFVGIEVDALPPPDLEPTEETDQIPTDGILNIAEKMPEFPGGEKKMLEFVQQELKYPEAAREQGIVGKVYVRFVIDENGDISQPEILKSADKLFNEPTLHVIKRMPKWTPGEDKGKKVKVYVVIPVSFKL